VRLAAARAELTRAVTGRILDSVYAKDKSAFEDNVMRMVVASACISALSVIQVRVLAVLLGWRPGPRS
jgi:hypothetical protein